MATPADVHRVALALPGAEKVRDRFAFGVRVKGKLKEFAWVWMERVTPKKPRVPNSRVLAVRVASLADKERLLADHSSTLFTEPHYEGFPAVLVRLEAVRVARTQDVDDGGLAVSGSGRSQEEEGWRGGAGQPTYVSFCARSQL